MENQKITFETSIEFFGMIISDLYQIKGELKMTIVRNGVYTNMLRVEVEGSEDQLSDFVYINELSDCINQ
jgi:hypothetical protein